LTLDECDRRLGMTNAQILADLYYLNINHYHKINSMNLQQLEQHRSKIIQLAEQYHSTNIRVFGSVAKGENTENSDIDFLIDPKPEQDLFDVIRLRRALQELLNCDVDIVHSTALHHSIKQEVLSSAIPL